MLQGITFDYDGTIGQTNERQFNWFRFWADRNGKSVPYDSLNEFMVFYNEQCGKPGGVQNVYDALSLPCDMKDREHPVWQAYDEFKSENLTILYPGIKKAILDIWEVGHLSEDFHRNRRLRLAINTTNSWKSIYKELEQESLLHCFDSVVADEILRNYYGHENKNPISKPSKISLALILGLIDCEGEHTMHIGDTITDLAASNKVTRLNPMRPETLITVGAAWGYEGREKLEQGYTLKDETTYFTHIIDHPDELLPIVKGY